MDTRTRRLLEGPIAPTLLALAAPNVVMLVAQVAISVLEAYFVGWLGAEALAGVSVTFPLVMLMQTMSAGGMGGGVASAVARALGAGRGAEASRLVAHAIVIALAMAAVFTAVVLGGGPASIARWGPRRRPGGRARVLERHLRGRGRGLAVQYPRERRPRHRQHAAAGRRSCWGAARCSWPSRPPSSSAGGRFPGLGVTGAAVAVIAYYGAGTLVSWSTCRRASLVRLSLRHSASSARCSARSCASARRASSTTSMTNLTVVLLTALVGSFGTSALAGYGMGARLEYLQIPLVFGFGSALVTMVGTNIGAGQDARARRVAWTGAAMAAGAHRGDRAGRVVLPALVALALQRRARGAACRRRYLRIVGPTYGFFGLGLALYFASQGAGRLRWPLIAGPSRLVVATRAAAGSPCTSWAAVSRRSSR